MRTEPHPFPNKEKGYSTHEKTSPLLVKIRNFHGTTKK